MRLDERLKVVWELSNVPTDAQLPPLSLQPLLENAIYYGIQPLPEGGTIQITGMFDGEQIHIDLENPLPPADLVVTKSSGNHIAQQNTQQRLQAAFGQQAGLFIDQNQQSYQVRLRFPYRIDMR